MSISKIKPAPDRQDQRFYYLAEDFPGKFLMSDERTILSARPVDVSIRGLGIISNIPLDMGAHIILKLGNERIRLEVMFCSSHLGIDHMFRVGLFSREASGSVIGTFEDAGLSKKMTDISPSQIPIKLRA